jgi:nanoRNase/pAp phosphatase (c-di-AMP/oligoRNAs hydrolase)
LNIRDLLTNAQRILVLGHHNADPDAIASMYAIQRAIEKLNPRCDITLACDDVSRLSNQVLETFSPDIQIENEASGTYDLVVLLDTNSRMQIGSQFRDYTKDPSKVLVIDHHEEDPDISKLAATHIIHTDRSSTCEIVMGLFESMNLEMDKTTANLLLAGMMFDTRRFFYADKETLSTALKLLEYGAEYQDCVYSLIIRPDRSERIARLKAASRTKIHTISKWVVATSTVNAFEASSCRGLIGLGADVAIIAGKPAEDVVRFSARSTKEFYEDAKVNLGTDVMEPLGEVIGGKGGGHPNAAGANGVKNRTKGLKKSIEFIRAAIANSESNRDDS